MSGAVALCADDYAVSEGVSRGILEALRAGRLTATSALVGCSHWAEGARALNEGGFDADIGLHFNLTLGAPLGPMPVLAPAGVFPGVGGVIKASLLGRLSREEIFAEASRQIDRFEAALGRPPDFLDGHHHVHAFRGVREPLLDALTARGLAGRCWLRDPADRLRRILARGAQVKKALIVGLLASGFGAAARRAGFATNDGFSGFSDFAPSEDYARLFASCLRAPGERHLVMCHPGHVDAELKAHDPVTGARELELAFLLSERFAEMLAERGLALARLAAA